VKDRFSGIPPPPFC